MSFPYVADLLNRVLGTDLRLPIPLFGLLVVVAIAAATFVARFGVERQEQLGRLRAATHAIVPDLALVAALAGIVGARVFYIADHPGDFVADPAGMVFSRSGFSIYGGLCFGLTAGILFLKKRKIPIVPMLDAVAPSLMLGYGIGRLGCQVAGDGDWGIAADMSLKPAWLPDWIWAQTYDGNILGITIPSPGVYPTPLYEFAGAMLLFAILWALRSRRSQPGWLFSAYLLCAGFERLLIEKIRTNVDHGFFGHTATQAEAISMLVIVAGLLGILLTLDARALWIKVLVTLGVLSALSACVPW